MLNLNPQTDGEENTFISNSPFTIGQDSGSSFSLLQRFTEAWMLEHEAPELLPYESILIDSMFSMISGQKQTIQEIPPGPDSSFLSNLLSFEVRRYF
jgi:hypothetical protein